MEKSVNKVELCGFAGTDPEIKNLNGKSMLRFSLATNSSYKNQKDEWVRDTAWHKIVMWNKTADEAQALIKKGSLVSLKGKITYRQAPDNKGGKQLVTEITAYSFESGLGKSA